MVDHDLKPTGLSSVDEIWVEDSRRRRIEQWRDEPLDRGMLQQEFTLTEEPALGDWTIKVKSGGKKLKAGFKVAEYVLPKFEVNIEAPSAVLRNDRMVTWRVCGNTLMEEVSRVWSSPILHLHTVTVTGTMPR